MAFAAQNAALFEKNAEEAARALSLYRGPYLEKETYEWAADCAREAELEYQRVALGLAGCYAAAGRAAEAESVLFTLLTKNPLSEEGHRALLDLHMCTGNRKAYLAGYEEYARVLKKELRLKPAAVYREHYEALRR